MWDDFHSISRDCLYQNAGRDKKRNGTIFMPSSWKKSGEIILNTRKQACQLNLHDNTIIF